MPNINATFEYTIDLNQTTLQAQIPCPFVVGSKNAHKILCHVKRNGASVDLTGAGCSGTAVVAGMTVPLTGVVSGSDCYVVLPEGAYLSAGSIYVLVTLTTATDTNVILYAIGTVMAGETDTIYDPTDIVPSLAELLAQIATMQAATTACTTATTAAVAAAADCEEAAELVEGMTATATNADSTSVVVTEESGHYNLAFAIKSNKRYFGNAITGTSTTPTAYATDIANAEVGDLYYYEGVDAANIGNIYRCTLGGNASTALWRYSENIRGSAGSGSVSMVFGKMPDGNGNVQADGGDIYVDDDAASPVTLASAIGNKVDKVSGKGLSTNDYTTTEKTKLAGIAEGANNYSLPTASASTLGGVKVGSGLSISNGVLSATGGAWTTLWTNNSATSAFSAQTVNLSLSGYSRIAIRAHYLINGTLTGEWEQIFDIGNQTGGVYELCCMGTTGTTTAFILSRKLTTSSSGVTFQAGYLCLFQNSAFQILQDNTSAIPYKIYGIK